MLNAWVAMVLIHINKAYKVSLQKSYAQEILMGMNYAQRQTVYRWRKFRTAALLNSRCSAKIIAAKPTKPATIFVHMFIIRKTLNKKGKLLLSTKLFIYSVERYV